MKKLLIFIVVAILLPCLWIACDDSKTYAELLEDERKAINKLISDSGFNIITIKSDADIPESFGEKDFVRLANGLYMNVIDFGDRNDMIDSGKVVLFRYQAYRNLFDTLTYSGNWWNPDPNSFVYGLTTTSSNGYVEGLATPLSFVGNNARVNLIIPSSLNNYTIMNNVVPYYYHHVRYERNIYED